ncbi:MAG: nucleotidyltransferase domain-containing protein [Dehalococcoidia bacterium]
MAEQQSALEAASRLAECVHRELSATAVYLFGSRARTDWHRGSDLDLIVVSDRFAGLKPWESWLLIEPFWDGPVDLQPCGLTPAQFEQAKGKGGLVDMAIADGMISLLAKAETPGTAAPAARTKHPA